MAFQDFRRNDSVNNVWKGRKSKAYRVPRRVLLAYRAVRQGTKIKLSDQIAGQFYPDAIYLAGGTTPVKQKNTLTYTGQPTADDTIIIGGETFTAKASPSGANQFGISGVDAKTTYDNLVAKVLALTSTALATGVNTGSGATGSVVFTANVAGTGYTYTESLALATSVTTQANVAGVGSHNTFQLSGSHVIRTGVALILRAILINGAFQHVYIGTAVIADDTPTIINARLVACGIAAQAGTNPAAGSYYSCTDPFATKAQIATGIQLKYGTSVTNSSFLVASTDTITVTALPANGTLGDKYEIGGESTPGPAGDLTNDTEGVPQLPGIELWGYGSKFNYDGSVSKTGIPCDQQLQDIAKVFTGATSKINYELVCDEDSELIAAASGLSETAKTESREQLLLNYASAPDSFGFIFVFADPNFDGEWTNVIALECQSGGVKFGRELRAHVPIPVECEVNAVQGGDETVIISRYRPAVTA